MIVAVQAAVDAGYGAAGSPAPSDQVRHLERQGSSPAARRMLQLALTYIQRGDEAHRAGRRVVYGGGMVDAPLLHSYDAFPCAFNELGRLSTEGTVAMAEDHFQIARETCSMVKATMGELVKRKGSFRKLINYCSQCEPYNAAFEVMKEEGYDIHSVDMPYRAEGVSGDRFESLVDFAEKELRSLGEWLGGPIDEERLAREIQRTNRVHEKVRRFLRLQESSPDYVSTLETLFTWNGANHNYGAPHAYEAALDELIAELEAYVASSPPTDRIPLLWAGGRGQEFGLFELIDQLGGYVAGWTIAGRMLLDYDERLPPVRAIAHNTVLGMGGPGGARDQIPFLERKLEATGAKGIIFYGYFGCSFSSVNREVMAKHFANRGIPSLILDGSFQVGDPTGQSVTRLKAFMEMVRM